MANSIIPYLHDVYFLCKKDQHALIKHDVDFDARVELEGIEMTALGLARHSEYQEIIKMLEEEGALELPPQINKE